MRRLSFPIALVVLMTGACKDEAAPSSDAAPQAKAADGAETPAQAGDGDGKAAAEAGGEEASDDQGANAEDNGSSKGIAGLTAELVDEARRSTTELVRYVPDVAEFVVSMRFAELMAYGPATDIWRKVEDSDDDFRKAVDTVLECMVSLDRFEDVVIGSDTEEHLVLAVKAQGLGKDETWRCFEKATITRGEDWDLTITGTPRGEGPQLVSKDGNRGYFPADDTLVMVSKEWDAEVVPLLSGAGTPAVEGKLAAPAGRIAAETPLWFAGRIGSTAAAGMSGTPFAGMTDVSLGMRITGDDLAFATTIDAGDDADATRMKDELTQGFEEYEGILPMLGFPASFGSKIAFETEGDLVSLDFTLTKSEIESIRGAVERTF